MLLHWNYFLSSVATDGADGNGLQFEKIRLNFSNSFSVLTLNRYYMVMVCFLSMKLS